MLSSLFLITFLSILSYLPLTPFLGFYSDDFFFGYIGHFYGPDGLIKSLSLDRPTHGYLLILNYFLLGLGNHVLLWHIYAFLIRLLGGYILFFLLIKLWPNRLSVVTSITLLFLIYPGFLQQTLPLGFSIWLTTLTLWITSLMFSVWAVKSNHKIRFLFFTLVSLSLQILTFLNLEFFIGMEVLRLSIISLSLGKEKAKFIFKTIKKSLVWWSPYLAVSLGFVIWRIFIFKSLRDVTDIGWVASNYYANPLWIIKIPLEVIYSFLSTSVFAYFIPLLIRIPRIPLENLSIAVSLGIVSAALLYFYFKAVGKSKHNKDLDNSDSKKFGKLLLIIGLISIMGALLPIIFSGRFVRLFNVFDRYTITSMIGVSFVIMGILFYKVPSTLHKWILISLIAISVTTHILNGFLFVKNWDQQKNIWWQLYWRAPNIENNAMLIFDFPPLTEKSLFAEIINRVRWFRIYWVDYQIWAPGNLFFNYDNLPKNHFSGDFLEDKGILDKIKNQAVESVTDRNITYTKDFRNTVIISTPSDTSCLWVLDKKRGEFPTHVSGLLKSAISYSDTDKLIKTDLSTTPPKQIFGNEPSHDWCYYFQKASLLRQLKQWDKILRLKEEVMQKGLKPKDPNEWLPFQTDLR